MLEIQLEKENLTKMREALEVLASYLPGVHNIYFEEDEVIIKEIDKTSVLGFYINFEKSFFKKYEVENLDDVLSVDINDMNAILEKAGSGSKVSITLEENDDKLTFNIGEEGKNKIYRIPLMENIEGNVEKAENGSVKKLDCNMELKAGTFSDILRDLDIGDDVRKFIEISVTRKGSPTKAKFNLYEKPDSAVSAEVTLTSGIINMTKVKTDQLGQYDMDYLDKLKKMDKDGDSVLSFSSEDIMRLKFAREKYSFIFFAAPIDVEKDEEEPSDEDDEEAELEEIEEPED